LPALAAFARIRASHRGRLAITPLGRWAAGLAGPADPRLTAGEMIAEAARFGDEEQLAFRGDSPVEYWSEEEPEEPEPFGINEVNGRLAALGREPV
jgi:hypothetical protein